MKLKKQTHEERLAWCRQYFKKRRKIFKKNGVCVNCQKEKAREGNVSCEKCLIEKRVNNRFRDFKGDREYYKQLIVKQKGRCAICKKETFKLVIDHKHGTHFIRGLLCNSCNVGIGLLQEDVKIFKRAIIYIS